MEVGSCSSSGRTDEGNLLAGGHGVARLNQVGAVVPVTSYRSVAVIDGHKVAVAFRPAAEDDLAGRGGLDRAARRRGDVETFVKAGFPAPRVGPQAEARRDPPVDRRLEFMRVAFLAALH